MGLANLPSYRANGPYVPIVTLVSNLTSVVLTGGFYFTTGNAVHASAFLATDAIATGVAEFRLSLPLARPVAAAADILGVANILGPSALGWSGTVIGNPTDDDALVTYEAGSIAARDIVVQFSYLLDL